MRDFASPEGRVLRLLCYNIRYATGTGPAFHLPLPGAGYLRSNRKVLAGITDFIRNEKPDIVGLIEVDTGSIRTGMVNQAEHIASHLGHYSTFQCKYGTGSFNTASRRQVQANARTSPAMATASSTVSSTSQMRNSSVG